MINEVEEFKAYTGLVCYTSKGKQDMSYLGRFTFDMILKGEGLARVLTILARGYLWREDGSIDYARRALCAWCSIPDSKKASPREDWQYRTDYREYSAELPELVDVSGCGWFYRHVHAVQRHVEENPDKVSKSAQGKAEKLGKGWDEYWRKKVRQYQIPLFSPNTKGGWVLSFDSVLADAQELGPLRDNHAILTPELSESLLGAAPGVSDHVLPALAAYYYANKPEDSDWVVLPVSNFDAYFGTTSFSRKWLALIPPEIMERQQQSLGVCRYRVLIIYDLGKTVDFSV